MPNFLDTLDTSSDTDTDIILTFENQKSVIAGNFSLYLFLLLNIVSFYEGASSEKTIRSPRKEIVKKSSIEDMTDDGELDFQINKFNELIHLLYNTKNYTASSFLELINCSNNFEFSVKLITTLKDRIKDVMKKESLDLGLPNIEITQISLNSPLKVKIKNASFALVLGIVISGGEMQANGFSFKVNSLADAIIKLKEAFWKPNQIDFDNDVKTISIVYSGVEIIIKELLQLEKLNPDDNLFEIGLDSILAVSLTSNINSTFNTIIPVNEIFQNPTMNKICNLILPNAISLLDLHANKLFSSQPSSLR